MSSLFASYLLMNSAAASVTPLGKVSDVKAAATTHSDCVSIPSLLISNDKKKVSAYAGKLSRSKAMGLCGLFGFVLKKGIEFCLSFRS